jgi:hypothetical protein
MKKKSILVVAAALCVGLVGCSEDKGEADLYTVLNDASRNGYAWMATNDFLAKDGGEIELNGKTYHDMKSILSDLRADGFTADTLLSPGALDVENKKMGCAWLRTKVFNFRVDKSISATYYTDECACLNKTRSSYTLYDGFGEEGGVIYLSDIDIHVSEYSKNYFNGEVLYYTSKTREQIDYTEKYKFEPIKKSELISNGLTKIDD